MSSTREPGDLHELAGEYVLGTLPAAERAAVQERLAQDAALRAAVQAWEERLLPLTELAEPVAPSPRLWSRIERSVGQAHATSRAPARSALRWWDNLPLWRGLGLTSFATAALLAAVLLARVAEPPSTPQYMVVLVAPQAREPGWVIQARDSRHVELIPLAVVEVPRDKALEFWTKADSWNAPVSLGLVRPGQTLRVPIDRLPPLQANQLFELTLEPATGSPTGRPTGPVQAIGRAVKVL